jgi:hypothetical protein
MGQSLPKSIRGLRGMTVQTPDLRDTAFDDACSLLFVLVLSLGSIELLQVSHMNIHAVHGAIVMQYQYPLIRQQDRYFALTLCAWQGRGA